MTPAAQIFSPYEVKLYMKQMLLGLKYCHDENVLHRDVKGANMLINNAGRVLRMSLGTGS